MGRLFRKNVFYKNVFINLLGLDLHCRAACRCSPNSAGPSWPPSDTADIHKNRPSQWEEGRRVRWQNERKAMCRGRQWINNDLGKQHYITDKKTNTSVSVWDITSAARALYTAAVFCNPVGQSQCIPHREMVPLRPCLPPETLSQEGFLPATTVRSPLLL